MSHLSKQETKARAAVRQIQESVIAGNSAESAFNFIQLWQHEDFGVAVRKMRGLHQWQWTVTFDGCELLTNDKHHRAYSYNRISEAAECAHYWFELTKSGTYAGELAFHPQKGQAIAPYNEDLLTVAGYYNR